MSDTERQEHCERILRNSPDATYRDYVVECVLVESKPVGDSKFRKIRKQIQAEARINRPKPTKDGAA